MTGLTQNVLVLLRNALQHAPGSPSVGVGILETGQPAE